MIHNEREEQLKKLLTLMDTSLRDRNQVAHRKSVCLEATKRRREMTTRQLMEAYRPETVLAWRTFLIPTELCYATGVLPFTPEIACATLSRNQLAIAKAIERAEECQYDLKLCSFLKTMVGGGREDCLPTPDVIVASPCYCVEAGSVLYDMSKYYDCTFFYLNLPLHSVTPEAIEFVAGQLRTLTKLFCEKTGIGLEEVEKKRLPEAIELSDKAAKYWKAIEVLRHTIPSPMSGREALDYATVLSQAWGSEEIVEIYQLLRQEVGERVEKNITAVPNEAVRLLWLHLRPYYSNEIMRWIEEAGGVVAFEEINFPARLDMDPSDPYHSLAKEILTNAGSYRVFSDEWKGVVRYFIKDFRMDGAIHFNHENCGWIKTIFPELYHVLQGELKVPVLSVSGDCLVQGRTELLRTRVLAFLEGLKKQKEVRGAQTQKKILRKTQGVDREYFVGIDAGAATTKAVIIDSSLEIVGWGVFSTGSDNKEAAERALKEALKMADKQREDLIKIVVTGVGSVNIPSHQDVTEITCHNVGMKNLFPNVRTIIDIGGQDTKAILVDENTFRMNDACAAGTGKFLEAVVRALEISWEELGKLDSLAGKALPISRMCAIFAESEIVSLVAKGSAIEEIVRGVHEMVGDKAIVLLKQLSREIVFPLAISGGVAKNQGVVRAIKRKVGGEILIPGNPQIVGAFGAAIIASRNDK